jgi:hypothetical protein
LIIYSAMDGTFLAFGVVLFSHVRRDGFGIYGIEHN